MTFHVHLEIREEDGSFAGRAISDESSREFHGWLGLMGAIEALYPAAITTSRSADQPTQPHERRR